MTFDDMWGEDSEVRRGSKGCTSFTWYPLYYAHHICKAVGERTEVYNRARIVNNLTSQAATMVTSGILNNVITNPG